MMRLNIQGNLLNRTEALEAGKAGINADNFTAAGKKNIVGLCVPDYETGVTGSQPASGSWTKVNYASFVISYGSDPYTENYNVKVSPDNGTTSYIVGYRYDDLNTNSETTCFSFFVPAGWYFRNYCEGGSTYHIYKLKGAN